MRCALFRQNAAKVRQALRDGLAVKVRGKVSLFEGRGDYQLIADAVEPPATAPCAWPSRH